MDVCRYKVNKSDCVCYGRDRCAGINRVSSPGESYNQAWKELPADWLEGLDIKKQVSQAISITLVYVIKLLY